MKIYLKTIAAVALAGLILAAGCGKQGEKASASTQVTIKTSEVSVQTLNLSVTTGGDTPSLVRLISPVTKETFLKEAGSLTDADKVTPYLTKKGQAISIPYQAVVKDLSPETEYVIGAVAFDAEMNVSGWAVAEVKTLPFGSVTLGDPSGAGSIDENIL